MSTDPEHIWLNAFSLTNPTDDFLAGLGRDVVRLLMDSKQPPETEYAAFRAVTIRIVAS